MTKPQNKNLVFCSTCFMSNGYLRQNDHCGKNQSAWNVGVCIVLTTGCTNYQLTVNFVHIVPIIWQCIKIEIIFLSYEWHIFSIVNPEQSEMSGRNSTKPEVTSSKGPSLILQLDCYNATTWENSHLNDKTNECLHLSMILQIFWYFFLLFWGCIYYVGGGGEGVRLN